MPIYQRMDVIECVEFNFNIKPNQQRIKTHFNLRSRDPLL